MAVNITITDAGRAEIINAENTGTAPVLIAEIGVGTGQYTPTASQTALQNETKRLTTFGGDAVGDDIIHVNVTDNTADAYLVYEFGLYTASGTLFAVYSQTGTPIIDKTAASILLLAVDIGLKTVNATSLTFGDTDFVNPPATTERQGVVILATEAEVLTGTNTTKAITPAGLAARTATTSLAGIVKLNNTVTSTSSVDAATANAAKMANDNANTRALSSRNITAGNGLTGGGDLTADRTLTLGTPGAITGTSTNSVTAESHTHAVSLASTLGPGIVQLNNTLTSTSTTQAATANSAKLANDNADARVSKSGDTMTGRLRLDSTASGAAPLNILGVGTADPGTLEDGDLWHRSNLLYARLNGITRTIYHTGNLVTISQAEAEAGVASTVRAFTALRVAQAIAAIGPAGGKWLPIADANSAVRSGFFSLPESLGAINSPVPGVSGSLLVVNGGADSDYITQTWVQSNNTDIERMFIRHKKGTGAWTAWVEMARSSDVVASAVPVGSIQMMATTVAPAGYLKANGAAVSRTTYADLFNRVGTFWGDGDKSTTFNLPDLRGEFIRCWDDGRGIDGGRSFGVLQLDQMQRIMGQITVLPSNSSSVATGAFTRTATGPASTGTAGTAMTMGFDSSLSPDARTSATTDGETRPRNIALLAYIKY